MIRVAHVITEGNLRAVQDFDSEDMWRLYILNTRGHYDSVQWMYRNNIQPFFKTEIPWHKDIVNETL